MLELHNLMHQDHTSEQRRLLMLASSAVLNVFEAAIQSQHEANKVGLGREDVRFLEVLKSFARAKN